jgi:hypothetical protein
VLHVLPGRLMASTPGLREHGGALSPFKPEGDVVKAVPRNRAHIRDDRPRYRAVHEGLNDRTGALVAGALVEPAPGGDYKWPGNERGEERRLPCPALLIQGPFASGMPRSPIPKARSRYLCAIRDDGEVRDRGLSAGGANRAPNVRPGIAARAPERSRLPYVDAKRPINSAREFSDG